MISDDPTNYDAWDDAHFEPLGDEEDADEDLWFLPPPLEDEPEFLRPTPRGGAPGGTDLESWTQAEAASAAQLARVAGRLGALDERLRRGPEGWRHRLALIEASDLSWLSGDRVGRDRLALWLTLHLGGSGEDTRSLARAGWAVRRLTGGPGPLTDLAGFLDRRDPDGTEEIDRLSGRTVEWTARMEAAGVLHPITRACMGYHAWSEAGLGPHGDALEAAVTAARITAGEGQGAIFAPLALGGGGALRATGMPWDRLAAWLTGMERALLAAMRHLDDIEAWSLQAEIAMAGLSGRTPPRLRALLADWPLVSAPMAEALTGASRAAVQRNLSWMEEHGLVREVTGQGRFRMWAVGVR